MTSEHVKSRMRAACEASPLTLTQIGQRMGYRKKFARCRLWIILNGTPNPTIDVVVRFARAVGVTPAELFGTGVLLPNVPTNRRPIAAG